MACRLPYPAQAGNYPRGLIEPSASFCRAHSHSAPTLTQFKFGAGALYLRIISSGLLHNQVQQQKQGKTVEGGAGTHLQWHDYNKQHGNGSGGHQLTCPHEQACFGRGGGSCDNKVGSEWGRDNVYHWYSATKSIFPWLWQWNLQLQPKFHWHLQDQLC